MRKLVVLLLAALATGGCSYLADRGLDLAQSADLSAGWSEGVDVNVRATKLLQVGVGSYRGPYWVGLKDGVFDVWQEERSELGLSVLYLHEVFRSEGSRLLDLRQPLFGDAGFREVSFDVTHLTDRGFFDVGATLDFVLIGADAALKPAEIVDFVAGLAGLDPLRDDVYGPTLEELVARVSGDDARVRAAAARALRLRTGEDYGYAIYTAPDEMPGFQLTAVRNWRAYAEARREEAAADAPPQAEAQGTLEVAPDDSAPGATDAGASATP